MNINKLDEVTSIIRQYRAVSDYLEGVILSNKEKYEIGFPVYTKNNMAGAVFFDIPHDTAETLLREEKIRLEEELAGLGVQI
jgi:hypothetical protein